VVHAKDLLRAMYRLTRGDAAGGAEAFDITTWR
jgi:hypothetical protein